MLTRRRFTQSSLAAIGAAMANPVRAMSATSAKAAGFVVPEESAPHELTFMQWPSTLAVYDDREHRAAAQEVIADIANAVSEFEPVVMLMSREFESGARRILSDDVEIWDIPTEDLWCRDSGPIFALDGKGGIAVTHLNFNGWGNREAHVYDGQVAARVAERLDVPFFDNDVVGEGGGVETDGDGTLIAHESSWVHPGRNAGTRDEIEQALLNAYGADKMIWAPGLIGHDITDYHIDSLARFVRPGQVAIQIGDRMWPDDVWSRTDFETNDILSKATDAKGRRLDLVKLPVPNHDWESSYANYYVCNGGILASRSADLDADAEARRVLESLYPGRELVFLDTDILGEAGGGIHCATQQMPKA